MKEEEDIRLGKQILSQEDISKKIIVGGEEWKVRIPTPLAKREIERLIARKVGVPLEQMSQDAYLRIRATTFLDGVIIAHPDWWPSAEECFDEDLVMNLFNEFIKFENEFRGKLKRSGFAKNKSSPTT